MISQKLIPAARGFLSRKAFPVAGHNQLFVRNVVQATPPRVRISFQEKMALISFICLGTIAYPVWVVAHVKEYQKPN
ncbi:hypothetical protein RUM43_010293 [Polyplax serrata]|uniref:Uncharacterized protein n=1 Tax=Polyplax serrata TaxID=468196 RepID=A0AAN8PVL3_POLSC